MSWLEKQLNDAGMLYRAYRFALAYPELVNSIADELGYQPPEPDDFMIEEKGDGR